MGNEKAIIGSTFEETEEDDVFIYEGADCQASLIDGRACILRSGCRVRIEWTGDDEWFRLVEITAPPLH